MPSDAPQTTDFRHRVDLDINPPVADNKAMVLIVRGGRCFNVVLPREAGDRVEALVRQEQANAE
jgi:hypothetical protein